MMKMSTLPFYDFAVPVCLVCTVFIPFVCSGSVNGRQLLKDATECSLKISFKSTTKPFRNRPRENIIAYGKTGRLRFEYRANQDRQKHYRIVEAPPIAHQILWTEKNWRHPIRLEFHSNWSWWPIILAMTEESRFREGHYRISKGVYLNRKCYKLIVKYPSDSGTLIRTSPWHFQYRVVTRLFHNEANIRSRKFSSDEFQANRVALRQAYFSTIELLIDENPTRPFIYSIATYNTDGQRLDFFDWGDVEFLDNLNESLFSPPSGSRIVKATDPQNFSKLYIDLNGTGIMTPQQIWWKRQMRNTEKFFLKIKLGTGRFCERLGTFLLKYGGKIAACIAAILIVAIIILKIREHHC